MLKQYDGQCVRITDRYGGVFDGICRYNDAEYDRGEWGRNEEGLQIESFLFFRSDIRSVESLEEHDGPYGRFLDPFGKLEELTVEDGIGAIRDVLFSEEKEHVLRLLNCLERYLDPEFGKDLPCADEIPDALRELVRYDPDPAVRERAEGLLERWGGTARQ